LRHLGGSLGLFVMRQGEGVVDARKEQKRWDLDITEGGRAAGETPPRLKKGSADKLETLWEETGEMRTPEGKNQRRW